MEIDRTPSEDQDLQLRAETLQSLSTGPLPSSISKISGSSRGIPSGKDFHFYYNFDEFKSPVDEIAAKSQSMLTKIGSSKHLWDTEVIFSEDVDDAYDLVANINDEVLERFDMSVDEFTRIRKAEEEGGKGKAMVDENGFQLVCGRKKKATGGCGMKPEETNSVSTAVRVAERDKKVTGGNPKIPFHIPTIRRPQDEYNILVNNSNQPFQHAWLQRSDDGSRFIHPLENHSFLDFVDRNVENMEPMKPPPLSSTPFKLVNDVKGLKELAAKLRAASEFALFRTEFCFGLDFWEGQWKEVDLEHNQYRSFQGLTCLMQISTRTEDFVVDTLKLRIQIGPYLREIFKDPTKKKVIHGADSDILWLQRDFGIYVCNLFDTGQASRVLKLERNSLEYLLQHFCGVVANKEYQKADWRLRPLPMEMIRYAREDTHYLLYIYDLMRIRLLSESPESDKSDALLVEVYERSYKVCMQLYEKELLTDSSYLRIYGLQGANFNAQQLAIVAGLCEWRDIVARSEDESTGYILPNKTLLEIAKQMPVTTSKLRRLVRSKHPYIERNLSSVINIIRLAMQNAEVFEPVAQQLKEAAMQAASESNTAGVDGSEVSKSSGNLTIAGSLNENGSDKVKPGEDEVKVGNELGCCDDVDENKNVGKDSDGGFPDFPIESIVSTQSLSQITVSSLPLQKASGASVQVLKRPNRAFGALLGNSTTKKKVELNKGKEESKLEQIKSSVSLPFYAFSVADQQTKEAAVEPPSRLPNFSCSGERSIGLDASTASEDVIELENSSGNRMETPVNESANAASDQPHNMEENAVTSSSYDEKDEPVSLFDLSSSFQQCLKSTEDKQQGSRVAGVSEKSGLLGFKPFDYATARKEVKFGERARKELRAGGNEGSNIIKRFDKKAGMSGVTGDNDGTLPQGKRREAFPASGNRSATFR